MQAQRDLAHADSRLPVGVKIALRKKEEETSKEPRTVIDGTLPPTARFQQRKLLEAA